MFSEIDRLEILHNGADFGMGSCFLLHCYNLKTIRSSKIEFIKTYFEKQSDDKIRETLARLFAFDNARAMLDITKVFEKNQILLSHQQLDRHYMRLPVYLLEFHQ